jgi:hypothetical protein
MSLLVKNAINGQYLSTCSLLYLRPAGIFKPEQAFAIRLDDDLMIQRKDEPFLMVIFLSKPMILRTL